MKRSITFQIIGIILTILVQWYFLLYLNHWRGDFWQQISDRQSSQFWIMIWKFSYSAFILVYSSAAMTWLISKLSLNIRKILTIRYLPFFCRKFDPVQLCTKNDEKSTRFPNMSKKSQKIDNPEERLSTDLSTFVNGVVNLISGFIFNTGRFLVFTGVLIVISKQIWNIPYILLLGTCGYSLVGVLLAILIGKNLTSTNYYNKQTEASFRFGLSRVRLGNDDDQHHKRFNALQNNNLRLFNQVKILNIFIGTYSQSALIIPILFLAPAYFHSPLFTFGLLMQAISAFGESSDSLSYLTNNWQLVTEIKACYNRLNEFKGEFL